MKTRFISLAVCALFLAAALSAQTKTSGTAACKPDPATPTALTDKPNHAFMVGRATCTWTGFDVAGLKSMTGISTDLAEITGDATTFHGYHVATMDNGDTTTAKYQGSGKLKDGKLVNAKGTWMYTGGTGKLKGIKGRGAFEGTANADGSVTEKIDGEYSLPK